ncbi:MAG: acyltransferase family protein [Clostridia bacterium]|nr:acyltransferase family protein [Clostridia bacterium]
MILEKERKLTSSRNYGVDLLRIVAMFMVLFLHILGNGGILFELEPLSARGITAWFFEMATFSAINCYGIISGFVGVNSKYKYTNLVLLWLQVAAYSTLITLVYHFRYPALVGWDAVKMALTPICNQQYWYVTAYAGMFLFIPILSKGAKALTKKQLGITLIFAFVALSLLPAIYDADIFATKWGYSLLWLSFLYLTGAYIKLYGIFKNNVKIALFVYLGTTVFSWVFKIWEEVISTEGKYADLATGFIAQYTSPPMLLSGIALFVVFANLDIPAFLKKAVKIISPCAFGVYIIHAHPLLWDRLITYRYAHFTSYNPFFMILAVFFTALIMFTAFSLVDAIRLKVFNLLKIRPLLLKAEDKITGGMWDC